MHVSSPNKEPLSHAKQVQMQEQQQRSVCRALLISMIETVVTCNFQIRADTNSQGATKLTEMSISHNVQQKFNCQINSRSQRTAHEGKEHDDPQRRRDPHTNARIVSFPKTNCTRCQCGFSLTSTLDIQSSICRGHWQVVANQCLLFAN